MVHGSSHPGQKTLFFRQAAVMLQWVIVNWHLWACCYSCINITTVHHTLWLLILHLGLGACLSVVGSVVSTWQCFLLLTLKVLLVGLCPRLFTLHMVMVLQGMQWTLLQGVTCFSLISAVCITVTRCQLHTPASYTWFNPDYFRSSCACPISARAKFLFRWQVAVTQPPCYPIPGVSPGVLAVPFQPYVR